MKKKEKGFTLIELLVVIAILTVILLIAVPITVSNLSESKEETYNNQITLFVSGAERYALEYSNDLTWEETDVEGIKKTIVTLRELADKDYVDLPVTNPITGEEFDPDTTRVIIYKKVDGSLEFEFEDINGFRIVVGTKVQTILQSTEYTEQMIMSDIYGIDSSGRDVTNEITYTCKYREQDVDCNMLKSKTKELGTYYITYELELNGKIKSDTRTIKVVAKSTPTIVVRPEDTGIKVDKVRVTILYPDGAISKTYSTKYVSNKDYQIGFDVTENQIIKADCIDKNGLKCDTAQTIIKHIKTGAPKIESTVVPTPLENGYAKSQVSKVTYGNVLLTGNQYFVKTTTPGVSSLKVTVACGTGELPNNCTGISETTNLSANTWYRVSGNVNITYNTTFTETGTLYAVLYDTTFSEVTKEKIEKIDVNGPKIQLLEQVLTTKTVLLAYSNTDLESGVQGNATCKYGTSNGKFDKNGIISDNICKLDNLKANTTYYYQICSKDALNNETCKTGSTTTPAIINPTVTFTNTPTSAVNGYLKQQVATVNFNGTNITLPEYFIKTTKAGASSVAVSQSCGSKTTPESCKNIGSTKNLSANTWYKVSGNVNVTYSTTSNTTGTIYAMTYDGLNYSGAATGAISKIDNSAPSVTLKTSTVKTNSVIVPYTLSDEETNEIQSVTCKYGTSNGNYTTNGESISQTSCTLPNLKSNTTYYYQICATDKLGNKACKTDSKKTATITNPTVTFTNTPATAVNGYLKQQVAKVSFNSSNISSPQYFIKTTRIGASNLAVSQSCGSGTMPSSCKNIGSTKNLAANTWYKVSGNVNVTYSTTSSTTGTIYALTYDGVNYSSAATGTISKIDNNGPTVTLRTPALKTNSVVVTYTLSDSETNTIEGVTCKYGTSNENYTTNGASISQTSCTLPNLKSNTTYYYQICATDKFGNTTCRTSSTSPMAITNPTITFTNTPTMAVNGYVKQQVAKVSFNGSNILSPQYFIKTTRAGASNLAVSQSCGSGTMPSSCTNIGSTKNLAANTWYKVSGNINVTYSVTSSTTGTIYALTYDGVNYSSAATGTISKIDNTVPTARIVVVNGAGTTISNNGNIGRTNGSTIKFECDAGPSGVKSYLYSNTIVVEECVPTIIVSNGKNVETKECRNVNKTLESNITTTPHILNPTSLSVPSTTPVITHHLTCTNNIGNTSSQVSFTTNIVDPPTVSLKSSSVTATSITVKATGKGTSLKYRYSMSNSFSGNYTTSTTNTFSGLTSGSSYTLWVEATDSVGQVATSSVTAKAGIQCPPISCGPNNCGHVRYNSTTGSCYCDYDPSSSACQVNPGPGGGGGSNHCTDASECMGCIASGGNCGWNDENGDGRFDALDVSECLKKGTCG